MGNILKKAIATKQEDQKLEALAILYDCQLCHFPISPSFKFTNCPHIICKNCIAKHINSKLDVNAIEITCPANDCKAVFDPVSCRDVLDDQTYQLWLDRLCYAAIAKMKKSYCPYNNCRALIVDECGSDQSYEMKSKCPKCKRWMCFCCRRTWHNGQRCNFNGWEKISLNDMLFMEMTAGNKKKLSSCPKCHMYTELVPRVGYCIIRCRCKTWYCFYCGNECTSLSCNCNEFEEEIKNYNRLIFLRLFIVLIVFGISLCIWAKRIDEADVYF